MTNDELNRAVALARGYTPQGYSDEFGEMWADPAGRSAFLPDVALNPADWGALFEELARRGMCPGIESHLPGLDGDDAYEATMYSLYPSKDLTMSRDVIDVYAATPGRALALAFLKAVGS